MTGSCSDASRLEDYSDSELDPEYPPPLLPDPSAVGAEPAQFLWDLVVGCADRAVETVNRIESFKIKISKPTTLGSEVPVFVYCSYSFLHKRSFFVSNIIAKKYRNKLNFFFSG